MKYKLYFRCPHGVESYGGRLSCWACASDDVSK